MGKIRYAFIIAGLLLLSGLVVYYLLKPSCIHQVGDAVNLLKGNFNSSYYNFDYCKGAIS